MLVVMPFPFSLFALGVAVDWHKLRNTTFAHNGSSALCPASKILYCSLVEAGYGARPATAGGKRD